MLIGDALGPHQLFICASTLFGLLLPALVITRVVDGPGAVRALLASAVRLRAGLGWSLLALLGVAGARGAAHRTDIALQHISGVVSNGLVGALVLVAVLAVLVIPFRFRTGRVHNRTGGLFVVGLVHGMGNAVAGGSGFRTGLLAFLYPGQMLASMVHLLAFFLVGLVVLVATRGRLGRPTEAPDHQTVERLPTSAAPGDG